MTKKTKILIAAAGGLGAVLALPVMNLLFGPDNSGLLPPRSDGVPEWKAAAAVLGKKCVHCHALKAKRPFYASLPVARGMVNEDTKAALAIFNAPQELYRKGKGMAPVSEAALAKLEHAIAESSMPPTRYVMLHWNHRLSSADRAALKRFIRAARAKYFATPGTAKAHALGPLQPLPEKLSLNAAKVALGQQLFVDKRLSGDGSVSCETCHGLDKGGTDRLRVSKGIRGQMGPINSPTVYNSAYQIAQFWDGRAATLEEQAAGPVENPLEMGAKWKNVVERLRKDEALLAAMKKVYPDGITAKNVQNAIAEFERSLVTPSRLDRYLRGDAKALSAKERAGLEAFVKRGCAMCHVGKGLGGQSYEKMGLYESYFSGRKITDADLGRYNVTKRARDRHRFKVPILRNVAITPPYFHDGSTSDLAKAVSIMASHQVHGGVPAGDREAIVVFLKSLTGMYRGKLLR